MATQEPPLSSSEPKAASISVWIKRNALLAYFLLAFGLTWPFMIAEVLGSWDVIPFRLSLSGAGLPLVLFIGQNLSLFLDAHPPKSWVRAA